MKKNNNSKIRIVTIHRYLLLIFLVASFYCATANRYYIQSAVELRALVLKAGDTVIMKEGNWRDQRLVFEGKGTEALPIVLTTTNPGKIILNGNFSLTINGKWLTVSGLYFKEGIPAQEDVILFSDSSMWCRLTNTAIADFNPPDKKTDSRYVSLHGANNRVDHCFFKGKTNHGPTLVVWLSERPNYHMIDHNHFGYRPPLGENGGETIRIGTSTWSMYDSYTTVEYNLFDHCDGELEIISNKSCHNTIRYNTFFESKGTLTLRHGNDAVVFGNFFIGNNIDKTGGIRIIGEDHVVFGNYLRDLRGSDVSAAICMVDGIPDSPLTGYFRVKNAQVINNVIVRCEEAFSIGTGKSKDRYLTPLQCIISSNQVVLGKVLIKWNDMPKDLRVENNLWYTDVKAEAYKGFSIEPLHNFQCAQQKLPAEGIIQKPPLIHEDVGTWWREG